MVALDRREKLECRPIAIVTLGSQEQFGVQERAFGGRCARRMLRAQFHVGGHRVLRAILALPNRSHQQIGIGRAVACGMLAHERFEIRIRLVVETLVKLRAGDAK